MSHYTRVATAFVSATHIAKALVDVGFEKVEVFTEPQPLRGIFTTRAVGHVIARRRLVAGEMNDVGFLRRTDGHFDAVVEDMDRERYDAVWMGRLRQRYAYHATRDLLTAKGFEIADEQTDERDTLRLTLRRMT